MLDKIRGRRPADGSKKLCKLTLVEGGEKGTEIGKLAFADCPDITETLLNVREQLADDVNDELDMQEQPSEESKVAPDSTTAATNSS